MRITIRPGSVDGAVDAPPSKSYTQRAVACALMADGQSEIVNPSVSEDCLSALEAARLLGAKISRQGANYLVLGGPIETPEDVVNCGGSATALRIFTAVSAHAPGTSVLTGDASLRRRPMADLLSAMNELGVDCRSTRGNGLPPIIVNGGGIPGGSAELRGDVSSQFVSALLISCTRARGDTTVTIRGPLESKHYVDMTVGVLADFGASVSVGEGAFKVSGHQRLAPCRFTVEGDYSSASFMMAAGLLCGRSEVRGLISNSRQGDRQIVDILRSMGGCLGETGLGIVAEKSDLRGISLDARQVPDLVPILSVVATQAQGETTIADIGRLRLKESNRMETIVSTLQSMGATIGAADNAITIRGKTRLTGATINPSGDHRIAMACAVAALMAEGDTIIEDAECISKSYPTFAWDLKKLGADLEVEGQ
jgi:3-phosphoshikimate 1-carboxyvinyltransferase